ncbi:MAG: hypothetical protein KQJ78_12430 [Deltaproteobacteria bacterium]|nr:hypothetical protein [Deltaproteobacteria bacterium]
MRLFLRQGVLGLWVLWALSLPGWAPAADSLHTVLVTNATELADAVWAANFTGGDTNIVLADGVYNLDDMLWVEADNVTVTSQSGNRAAVTIQGQGMTGPVSHVFNVAGSNFRAENLTLRNVANHAVQMQPAAQTPILRNLHILDTGEQMIKVSWDQANPGVHSDGGLVERCVLEYSAGIGPQWYIGGIDAHAAVGWVVRNNVFRQIRSPADDVAEHAVHFWSGSTNTLVEKNVIVNCDRGIGFGLGDRGHHGGIIRNNMIYHDTSEGFADVGISLESADGAQVYNNTVIQEHTYLSAIEYRFAATTGCVIENNLTNREITDRDSGLNTVSHNYPTAQVTWFAAPSSGDLHLTSAVAGVVDSGLAVAGLTDDFDGTPRPQGPAIDIGAHELGDPSPTAMYRAYNPNLYYHFFTTRRTEFDNAVAHGYNDESTPPPFYVMDGPGGGASAVYRLYNAYTGLHYYTKALAERLSLESLGWAYERVEGYIFGAPVAETSEVYKLYHTTAGRHLYTIKAGERNWILANLPGWEQHSSLGFAYPVLPTARVEAAVALPGGATLASGGGEAAAAARRLASLTGSAGAVFPETSSSVAGFRAGTSSPAGAAAAATAASGPARRDFDGNGRSDLVWWDPAGGEVRLGLVSLEGGLAWQSLGWLPGSGWSLAAVLAGSTAGEFRLVWWHDSDRQGLTWLLAGATRQGSPDTPWVVAPGWRPWAAGDFDGDGAEELAWRNQTSGEILIDTGWLAPQVR